MPREPADLPDFSHPPVTEVVLGLQFEPLRNFGLRHFGLLWKKFSGRFPNTEDHPPLDPVIEQFGAAQPGAVAGQIKLRKGFPFPRCWFLNDSKSQLIQIQRDRFILNWRKTPEEDEYPRYKTVRDAFSREFDIFRNFIETECREEITPNQCEVTYVNHIESGKGWSNHGELQRILTVFENQFNGEFLPEPEEGQVVLRFVIPGPDDEPLGRLRISLKPVFRIHDKIPMFLLELVARGRPYTDNMADVMGFLDLGREWIVKGFAEVTRREMHTIWGRCDDNN